MKRTLRRTLATSLVVAALCCAGAAQQSVTRTTDNPSRRVAPQSPVAGTTNAQGNVDENFELNIGERRITEQNFFASTEIAAGDESARGLNLRVGVAVGASEIDVLLRNVQGRVRFRASLDALRRVLDARRASAVTAPPSNVP